MFDNTAVLEAEVGYSFRCHTCGSPMRETAHGHVCTNFHCGRGNKVAGMQSEWEHKIPKHSAQCGKRISLTYRKLAR